MCRRDEFKARRLADDRSEEAQICVYVTFNARNACHEWIYENARYVSPNLIPANSTIHFPSRLVHLVPLIPTPQILHLLPQQLYLLLLRLHLLQRHLNQPRLIHQLLLARSPLPIAPLTQPAHPTHPTRLTEYALHIAFLGLPAHDHKTRRPAAERDFAIQQELGEIHHGRLHAIAPRLLGCPVRRALHHHARRHGGAEVQTHFEVLARGNELVVGFGGEQVCLRGCYAAGCWWGCQ